MPVNEIDESIALVTLLEARLYCNRNAADSSRDEQLIEAINDVSAAIRDWCEREFVASTGATALAGAIDDNDVALTVASADGFPSSGSFYVKVDDELMLVTAGAGSTTWTVTRAQLGTTAAAHLDGAELVELEARDFAYGGNRTLDLGPFDLRELERVTLYTDLDAALHDELETSGYRLAPTGRTPAGTYLGLVVPSPAVDEAAVGFGWQTTVLGRWGMSEVPGSVKLAAKIWIDNIVKNPGQFQSNTMAGYSVFPEVDEEGRHAGMPPATRHRLEPWRRVNALTFGGTGGDVGTIRFANPETAAYPTLPLA